MERQLPKNVRQIGNVCDEPKIYVEDYVDTFLGQLQEKAMEKPVAAALTGEITKCEDKVVVYISGAIRAEDVEVEGAKRVFQRSEINWLVSFGDRTSNEHESGSAGAAPENV